MRPLWDDETEQRVRDAATNMDEQTPPTEVKFCTKCVMSNQRPRITFNEDGVCSACQHAERKRSAIDWDDREMELADLLSQHSNTFGYDVIVPCSGGKDSSMVAHRLKHEYGMTPLCVSWASHIPTEIGVKNFDAFVHAGFDVQVGYPNGLMHRKLTRLAFELYGDPFLPFIYGQLNYPMHMAVLTGVKLVMFGENGEAEYGGDTAASDKPCWDQGDWERIYMKGGGVDKLVEFGRLTGAIGTDEEVSPFYSPPPVDPRDRPEFHWWSYYQLWHSRDNYRYAKEHTGFEPSPTRSEGTYTNHASLDDALDGVHYWMGFLKFGIGRCTSDAAHEVRDGDITRDEAVKLVEHYEGEFPSRYFTAFLGYVGMDEHQFHRVEERFMAKHLWDESGLKHRARA